MPKKISEEIVNEAIQMKKSGLTNKQIADILPVSVAWCNTNLKGVKKHSNELFEAMVEKSKTNEGIAKGEIINTLQLYDEQEIDAIRKLNNTVSRIRKQDKENIVRPDWMHPKIAKFTFNQIMQESLSAEQRIHEQAENIREVMLKSCTTEEDMKFVPSVNKLKNAVVSMVSAMLSKKEGSTIRLKNWTDSLDNIATKLEERNSTPEITDDFWTVQDYTEFDEEDEDFMY